MSTQATDIDAVRHSVTVDCSVEHAFSTFTDRIHEWWPLERFSIEADEEGSRPETVVFDGQGRRVYERTTKGEELKWADVLEFDPPNRVVLAWRPSRKPGTPTEVEVTFTDEGGKTRVDLEHRGWEKLGPDGAEMRQGYDSGWPGVLAGFAEAASG
jgi:uncharacterized protein YndB with AHSA1/START domain